MAISAGTNWEFETGGSDSNGGGFGGDVGTPQLTLTDGACTAGSTTFTSATGGFTAGMVGSDVVITSGTNFILGQYVITAQTNTNTVTLDHSPTYSGSGNGTGGNFTVSAGLDWAAPGATSAHATLTTASVVAATTTIITVKSTDYTVAVTDVGNVMFLTGGTATAGFYQIVAVTTGGDGTQNWTMDRAVGTAGQTCPGIMGGARKLISSNSLAAAITAGNTIWIKSGSYSVVAWSSQTAGTASSPINILGYNSSRLDNPTASNRPTLTFGTNNLAAAASTIIRNLIITGGSSTAQINCLTSDHLIENCKVTSTSATATSTAITLVGGSKVLNCEIIAASCIGVKPNSANTSVIGCYIHGCTTGINLGNGGASILNNIISGCTTGILWPSGVVGTVINNNTLFGAETPTGTGMDGNTGTAPARLNILNNIIYGFTTGIIFSAASPDNWVDYNDFFNNTTNRTNVTPGPHDVSINPSFTNTATGDFSITGAI